MSEEKVAEYVEKAMDADEFDILEYVDSQEMANDEVTINVNVAGAKRLHQLVEKRSIAIAERRALAKNGNTEPLGLDEAFEDTEYDDEVNALVEELDKTAITFEIKSVPPKLVRSIDTHYKATEDKTWSDERKEKHNEDRIADLLSRAIAGTRVGDGRRDTRPWDKERLKEFEKLVYPEEFAKLIQALYSIVYAGPVFEEALNADFS